MLQPIAETWEPEEWYRTTFQNELGRIIVFPKKPRTVLSKTWQENAQSEALRTSSFGFGINDRSVSVTCKTGARVTAPPLLQEGLETPPEKPFLFPTVGAASSREARGGPLPSAIAAGSRSYGEKSTGSSQNLSAPPGHLLKPGQLPMA